MTHAERVAYWRARLDRLSDEDATWLAFYWRLWGRPEQRPPEGDWTTWLLIGGRGSGKTRAGVEWVRMLATGEDPISPIALVGETMSEARMVMVDGPSGIKSVHPHDEAPRFDSTRDRWSGQTAPLPC